MAKRDLDEQPTVHRMTIELNDASKAQLKSLIESTGAASGAEVIRRAVSRYAKLVEAGGQIELIHEDGRRRLLLIV